MTPKTEAELAQIIKDAGGPLRIKGGGTRPIGIMPQGSTLDTTSLSGIVDYEPGSLTLVAQAGTPLSEIEAALDAEGQRLAFEPMDHRPLLGTTGAPTIGGVVAANVSGPRRIAVGACRDFLLGVRFVDGAGTILKNGGRVMKNVTGYDLVKLMAGSYGTLGVLSEVSFKVLPKPDFEATLTLHDLDARKAVEAMARALGTPFEVTGLAHQGAATVLRLEGFEASVRYRMSALKDTLAGFGEITTSEGDDSAKTWQDMRDVQPFAGTSGDIWRVSVKPSDAPELIERLGADAQTLLDWAGGLIWIQVPNGVNLRTRLGAFDGHATLIRADDRARATLQTFQPEPAALAKLSAGLRAKFDPRGILNSGLMGAGT